MRFKDYLLVLSICAGIETVWNTLLDRNMYAIPIHPTTSANSVMNRANPVPKTIRYQNNLPLNNDKKIATRINIADDTKYMITL